MLTKRFGVATDLLSAANVSSHGKAKASPVPRRNVLRVSASAVVVLI